MELHQMLANLYFVRPAVILPHYFPSICSRCFATILLQAAFCSYLQTPVGIYSVRWFCFAIKIERKFYRFIFYAAILIIVSIDCLGVDLWASVNIIFQ